MHSTRITLPLTTRKKIIALLSQNLADAIDLYSQIKQAHWNVRGQDFIALHELFDKVATLAAEHVDLLAERIAQLGGETRGTVRVAAKHSRLSEYPLTISDDRQHVAAVADVIAAAGGNYRKAITQSDDAGDAVTADLFTQIARELDKQLWFVEAHLQAND